jgi:hypothetical protein
MADVHHPDSRHTGEILNTHHPDKRNTGKTIIAKSAPFPIHRYHNDHPQAIDAKGVADLIQKCLQEDLSDDYLTRTRMTSRAADNTCTYEIQIWYHPIETGTSIFDLWINGTHLTLSMNHGGTDVFSNGYALEDPECFAKIKQQIIEWTKLLQKRINA